MAEPGPARLRRIRDQPFSSGRGRPRLQGRQRRADDHPLLRQRGLSLRHALAGGRAGAGDARQRDHPRRRLDDDPRHRRVPGLRLRPERLGLARRQVLADGRPGQRALQRRRALHALGRDLRRRATGPGVGDPGPGPCRRVAGWRVGGASATIDSVMVSEPPLPVVRRATQDDVTAMAAQLARTFFDDPVASHIFRNEARREAGLRAFFRTQIRADYLPFGGCYTTEGYNGSAIWAPAGKPMQTGLSGMLALLPVLPYVASNLGTTLRLLTLMETRHPRQPHWYLATLGTAVEQQGKGVGSALMRPVLEHCDAEGLPCYLESSKERNVPFYRRHGFEVVEEVSLPDDGPMLWTMWREPTAPD